MFNCSLDRSSSTYCKIIAPFFCTLILAAFAVAQPQTMPTISGENLAGVKVVLPEAANGKVAVLVFGFTKASKEPTKAWAAKLNSEFASQRDFVLYQLPVLEDVPRLVRGLVISSMKKGVPENLREHFVPILQGEAGLKSLVNYKQPDDGYLVVLNRSSQIVEQLHGASPDGRYAQLKTEIQSLLNQK